MSPEPHPGSAMMAPGSDLGLGLFLSHTFAVLHPGPRPPSDTVIAKSSAIMSAFQTERGEGGGSRDLSPI